MPAAINAAEWWLTYQAREVICCSKFMAREVVDGFELPMDKLHLVPNGVDQHLWAPPAPDAATPREPLVLAWGRVQYEKGFQVLASAMALLRKDGLVATRRDGQTIYYAITSEPAREILTTLYRLYCPAAPDAGRKGR